MTTLRVLLMSVCFMILEANIATAQAFSVKSHNITVKGTSSLHDWESAVTQIEAKGSLQLLNGRLSDINNVVIKIPVKAIKSAKGKMMDNKCWEAFGYEKNPMIAFVLREKVINLEKKTIDARGSLSMAGVTRPIEITLEYKILPGNALQVKGTKKLLMSDFKMQPPTAMMGTIKVGDEVEVAVDILLHSTNTL